MTKTLPWGRGIVACLIAISLTAPTFAVEATHPTLKASRSPIDIVDRIRLAKRIEVLLASTLGGRSETPLTAAASAPMPEVKSARFVIENDGDFSSETVQRVRLQLEKGLVALTQIGIPLRETMFPLTVRLKSGRGVSNSKRGKGPITLFYTGNRSAPIMHELTHTMAGYHWENGHWSQEGLASFVQDRFGEDFAFPTRKRPHAVMKVILENDAMLPMVEVMKDRSRQKFFTLRNPWHNWLAYSQSSSFVKFLIDTYGMAKFMAIYDKPFEDEDFPAHYGKSAEALVAEWVAHVRALDRDLTRAKRIFARQKDNAERRARGAARR